MTAMVCLNDQSWKTNVSQSRVVTRMTSDGISGDLFDANVTLLQSCNCSDISCFALSVTSVRQWPILTLRIKKQVCKYVRVAMAVVGIIVFGNTLSAVVEIYENNSIVLSNVLYILRKVIV